MDIEYKNALLRCETDIDAALQRLSGDEDIYEQCLSMFLTDQSMADFERALSNGAWDDAFTAVHALKGVAGNMGFIPLYQASAEIVILIRSGRIKELSDSCRQLKRCYDEILAVVRDHCQDPATN